MLVFRPPENHMDFVHFRIQIWDFLISIKKRSKSIVFIIKNVRFLQTQRTFTNAEFSRLPSGLPSGLPLGSHWSSKHRLRSRTPSFLGFHWGFHWIPKHVHRKSACARHRRRRGMHPEASPTHCSTAFTHARARHGTTNSFLARAHREP